jgi:hypothetical protein
MLGNQFAAMTFHAPWPIRRPYTKPRMFLTDGLPAGWPVVRCTSLTPPARGLEERLRSMARALLPVALHKPLPWGGQQSAAAQCLRVV